MDIKDLNKSQLILLALLLSFVTSLATGIVTVTLMQQAPDSVTVPINRVIRQTIEKIEQVEGKTTVQTIVVKEEDLIVDSIEKNRVAVFVVAKNSSDLNSPTLENTSRGFTVTESGVLVADAVFAGEDTTYFVENPSGKFRAHFIYADPSGFSLLKIDEPLEAGKTLATVVPVFGDIEQMKMGQKILILGRALSTLIFEGDANLKLPLARSNAGGMVLNLDGQVLGIALYNEVFPFVPISKISEAATNRISP